MDTFNHPVFRPVTAGQPFEPRDRRHSYQLIRDLITNPHVISPVILILTSLQCALLHPRFENSSGARWIRLALAPLTISWWISLPFKAAVVPIEDHIVTNTRNSLVGCVMTLKAIEWSFVSGPYHLRTLQIINGTPKWTKQAPVDSPGQESRLRDLAWWLVLQMTSSRGLRCSWGYSAAGNTATYWESLVKIVRLQILTLASLSFVLLCFEAPSGSPAEALQSIGVPNFIGLQILGQCLHSICLGVFISSFMEYVHLCLVLPTYLLHPLAKRLSFPARLCDACNPIYYPPLFNSLFDLSSLSYFWGKSWHQRLRRRFVVCGAKPAAAASRALGASPELQKVFGLFGAFTVSGLAHEYGLWVVYQPPHPQPRLPFKTFPGTFLFFFLQPFGILLEPYIIPRIPHRIGGEKLWTIGFLLMSSVTFCQDMCRPGGILSLYKPLNQWEWIDLVVPAIFKTGSV